MPQNAPVAARRFRAGLVFTAFVVAGLLLTGAVAVSRPQGRTPAIAAGVPASAPPAPATPYDRAVDALRRQSAALLRGDEAGWLAAVDTRLRTRYRSMFRSLRALDVTRFGYRPGLGRPVAKDAAAVTLRAEVSYCLGPDMCPDRPGSAWQGPPHIQQTLTLRPLAGRYVISAVTAGPDADPRRPAPWEGELVALRGSRVTLLAAPAQRRYLARLLPIAEAAARTPDRFAALAGTAQSRYRIYLAGERQWRTWYGGEQDSWAIGLAIPLNMYGIDVMLRIKELAGDPVMLRVALQHELGHVVTLSGAYRADAAEDAWLSEGIAEYIGWAPTRAARSLRVASVRWALGRADRPASMVPEQPGRDASARAGDAFYGLSHFAVDCMARRYGDAKLLTFVRLVLSEDNEYDQAARDAYGVPFATVDKACVRWIRAQAR